MFGQFVASNERMRVVYDELLTLWVSRQDQRTIRDECRRCLVIHRVEAHVKNRGVWTRFAGRLASGEWDLSRYDAVVVEMVRNPLFERWFRRRPETWEWMPPDAVRWLRKDTASPVPESTGR